MKCAKTTIYNYKFIKLKSLDLIIIFNNFVFMLNDPLYLSVYKKNTLHTAPDHLELFGIKFWTK